MRVYLLVSYVYVSYVASIIISLLYKNLLMRMIISPSHVALHVCHMLEEQQLNSVPAHKPI